MWYIRWFGSVMVALALVAGCGTAAVTGSGPAASGSAASGSAAKPGAEQLQFTATTLDGAQFSGQSLAGKPAVLWFWAPWCPTCRREAPGVAQAAQANSRVMFVGVAARDQLPAMKEFVANYHLASFTHLADLEGAVWQRFGITEQPAFAFIAADGTVEVVKNTLTAQQLAERLHQLDRT